MPCQWKNKRATNEPYSPTELEHIANVLTHGVMIPVAVMAAVWLVVRSHNLQMVIVSLIYGISLISLFTVSSAFHTAFYYASGSELMERLRKGDRAVIYIFIAASYTPYLVFISFPNELFIIHLRWILWVLAGFGVLFETRYSKNFPILGIMFYVMYGLLPGLLMDTQMAFPGAMELKLSGALYLVGVVFFRCDGIIPLAHAIWHLFVIFGVVVHYMAIYKYFYAGSNGNGLKTIGTENPFTIDVG